jgi:predicted RNA binding protein YcfA (HicA-like mRNA interferase family)
MDKAAWEQIKSITTRELMDSLKRDGWALDAHGGSSHIFRKGSRIVQVHHHPGKTYGPNMLKGLLKAIGWSSADMRRLKLIR